jgi:broad specificity phosphatase PhoE
MTIMHLVRHGRSVWNAAGRIQGQIDIELDEIGWQQAQRIADWLEGEPIAAIYASPLLRAKATADAIAGRFNLPVTPDPRLMEYDFGVISGMTWAEVTESHPELADRWLEDPWAVPVAGSEGRVNFAVRVMSAMQDICASIQRRTRLWRMAVRWHLSHQMLGLDLNRRHPFHFGNTSWSWWKCAKVFHIHELNNTCHLVERSAYAGVTVW